MKNLMKWELKQTFSSKAFWGILVAIVIFNSRFMIGTSTLEECSGFELFLRGCNDLNSSLLLLIGVFAGVHVTGTFEDRRIQSAVMAGNSRFSIIVAKLISFSLAVGVICISTMLTSFTIASFAEGTVISTDAFFSEIVMRIFLYTLAEISWVSLCFLFSVLLKKLGAAIAVNTISMITLNLTAQLLMDKEWVLDLLKFTPLGQTFLLIGDVSTGNIILSVVVSVTGLAVVIALSYLKFRKEELK